MSRRNSPNEHAVGASKMYVVIGEDDSIYLSSEARYLKKGEEIGLTDDQAQMLIAVDLVKPLKQEAAPETIKQFDKE